MKRACSAPAGAKAHSVPLWRKITVGIVLAAHLTSSTGSGASPAWWYQRGVITDFTHDDYAVINAGQLKNAIRAVVDEMEAKVPGGAGTDLTTLVNGWRAENTQVDNEVAVNQGQVKAAVKLVYDRLNAVHNTPGYYPWNGLPSDDFALANVGQLKHLLARDVTLAPNVDQSTAPAMTATHTDADADGLPLWAESLLGTDPANPDSDADGTPDGAEDTDGDGLADAVEILLTTNPQAVDSDGDGTPDGEEDPDGDGLSNLLEVALETNPLLADSDGDGIPDSHEDSDGDGVRNFMELLLGTHPAQVDSNHNGIPDGDEDHDGDGLRNALEEALGTNPLVADTDNNGVADGDEDTDGDGISNAHEAAAGTNPADANSKPPDEDADGVPDAQDAVPYDAAFTHAPSAAPGYYVTLDLGSVGSSESDPTLRIGINGHMAWVIGEELYFWNPATGLTTPNHIPHMSRTPADAEIFFHDMAVSPTGLIAGSQDKYGNEFDDVLPGGVDGGRPYVYNPLVGAALDVDHPAKGEQLDFPEFSSMYASQGRWGPDNKLYVTYFLTKGATDDSGTRRDVGVIYPSVQSSGQFIKHWEDITQEPSIFEEYRSRIRGDDASRQLILKGAESPFKTLIATTEQGPRTYFTNQSFQGVHVEGVSGHSPRPWLAANHPNQPDHWADHVWLPRSNGYTQHRIYGSREHRDAQQPLIYVGSTNKHGLSIVAGQMPGSPMSTVGVWSNGIARSLKDLMGEDVYSQYASDQWIVSGISDNGIIAMSGVRLSDNTRRVLALLPIEIEGYKRGTISAPGPKVPKSFEEYGQETVLMENADFEDNESQPDYSTAGVGSANDDDLVKVVLRWPKNTRINGVKLELKHKGLEVDPTKTADSDKFKELESSRLNFYKPDGTRLTDDDLRIDDLAVPGGSYLADILTTGELTLFVEGAENFGNLGLSDSKMNLLGGGILNFEATYNATQTSRARLLVYRGGFLVFRQPNGQPGHAGTFEFWDGKGRIKNKNGGYQNEFQEDVTDWGTMLESWTAKSGKTSGSADYRRNGRSGYVPPGWWWTKENPLHVNEQQMNPASGKITNRNKANERWNQAGFSRWQQDDAPAGQRYTNDFVYDKGNIHDRQIGQPTLMEFKFRLFAIPPSTAYNRTNLLIHPDGKKDGTLGCIGLQTWDGCNGVAYILRHYHGLKLKVQHN